jgi:membrane-bound metal-dependent hydrolase YbcI (DUF457 family)
MAGFKTHITTSTVLGIGYGAAGFFVLDAPLSTCLLSTGLCSVAGMLPDLDSESGVPVRETMAFTAAVIPMLMIDRFRQLGWTDEMMVLAAGLIYVAIRFGVAEIFKRYTVHRGMWHSLPAAASAGMLAYLLCSCADTQLRLYKTGAVVLGFMSHLILDELWSVEVRRGRMRLKKSAGTALKLWSKNGWANFSTYAKLALLTALVVGGEPMLMDRFGHHQEQKSPPRVAREPQEEVVPNPLQR